MAASRTGTASQVNASAASGSTSVTVPADATACIAFWSHFNSLGASTLGTKTLGGNAFTTLSENACKSPSADSTGVGVAILENLPGTGTQTFAWAWSDSDARDEGGEIVLVWIKDHNAGDAVRDSDVSSNTGTGVTASITLTTITTDLVLGFGQSFTPTNPATSGTAFVSNQTVNSEIYDATEVTAGAATTGISVTNGDYVTVAGVALKAGAGAPAASPTYHRSGLFGVS